jgi:hypothetical protein
MPSSVMLRLEALVRTYVSEEHSITIIRVTRIDELGKMLAVSSNRCMLPRDTRLLVIANAFLVHRLLSP